MPVQFKPQPKVEDPSKESFLGKVGRRFLWGPSPEDLGGVEVLNPMEGEPIIPRVGDWGKYGNIAQDFVRGLFGTPEGLMGAGIPSKMSLPSNVRIKPKTPFSSNPRAAAIQNAQAELANIGKPQVNIPTPTAPVATPTGPAPRIRTSNPAVGKQIMNQIQQPKVSLQTAIPTPPPIVPPVAPTAPTVQVPIPKPGVIDILNIPKATSASIDISNPFRQSLVMIGRPEWWKSWGPMMKSLVSEEGYQAVQKGIVSNPRFQEAVEHGLALTNFPGQPLPAGLSKVALKKLAQQEEQFASRVAEKITGGKYSPIRGSNRAYTAFANNLRMSVYDKLASNVDDMARQGTLSGAPDLVKTNVANYINAATGRGSMGLTIGGSFKSLEKGAELLNTVFWSPRFLASRVQLLNPVNLYKLDPFTRKQYVADMAKAVVAGSAILGLEKEFLGADVETDPTNPDFAKGVVGKTRVDLTGGFNPLIRFFAQGIDGLANISKDKAQGPDVLRFLRSKLSPAASLIVDMYSGEDYLGNEIESREEQLKRVGQTFVPMIAQDLYELYQEDPELLGLGAVSLVGGSVQVHDKAGRKGIGPRVNTPKVRFTPVR